MTTRASAHDVAVSTSPVERRQQADEQGEHARFVFDDEDDGPRRGSRSLGSMRE
jgi:hypothetical protein